jgi:Zn-finger nucleic acid-binding protein
MSEARVYQCPVCGAFARAGDRACQHCQAQLATLRCRHCFELNYPNDLHCRGCGLELGLAPDPHETTASCPDCKLPLRAFEAGAGQLLACERCGGQMVTHGLLRALIEQREALGRAVPTGSNLPRGNPLTDPVRYRPCPTCGHMMNRKNFGGTSGIVVDVCARHGTFFDAGELPRVLEFVSRGGLAKAQAVIQNAAPRPAGTSMMLPAGQTHELSLLDDVVDLLGFIVDVLRHK